MMMYDRSAWRSVLLAIAGLMALVLSGCGNDPVGPADAFQMEVKGITIADWSAEGYATQDAEAAVAAICATGANRLTILITAYQANVFASDVRIDNQLTPTQSSVSNILSKADPTCLRITLKLHVDLDDGSWRGNIDPSDPDRWFASYSKFVLEWAKFAALFAGSVDQFVVGTELASTHNLEGRWRKLIADVRDEFSGELLYAASWDEAPMVPFWDAVDIVGINFYAPVTARAESGRLEILRGWQPWLDRMRLLHKQTGKDIILSEIGYRSIDGAGMHPYDFDRLAAVDLDEQADLYWAALQAVAEKPWILGFYWWNWLANDAGPAELTDYTPRAKPAEKELMDAWLP